MKNEIHEKGLPDDHEFAEMRHTNDTVPSFKYYNDATEQHEAVRFFYIPHGLVQGM